MEAEKGKTAKYMRSIREISPKVKEHQKIFNQIKKAILNALKEGEMTIPQLAEILNMPKHEVMYYLMSLLKFGFVETGSMDDDDEYFYYKIKE